MEILHFSFFLLLGLLTFLRVGDRLDRLYSKPIYAFLLGTAFIYGFIPLLKELNDVQTYPAIYSVGAKVTSLALSFLFTAACVAGYWLCGGFTTRTLPDIRALTVLERRRLFALVGLPSLLALIYLSRTVSSYALVDYMKDRIMIRRGMGPVVILAFAAVTYGAILINNNFVIRKAGSFLSTWRFWGAVMTVLAISAGFVAMGNRNFVFILILIVLFASLSIFPGRLRKLFLIMPILFAIAVGLSAWAKVRTTLDVTSFHDVAADGPQKLLVYGLNGAFGNEENMVWLVQYSDKWDPLLGETVLAALVNPIPRSLWQNKPFGGGPALRNFIHPGSYVLNGEDLTSYTTGLPIEGYMNFGIMGLPFFGLINGMLLALARNVYARKETVTSLGVVVYSFTIFMFSFGFLYMELLGGWSRYFIVTALLLSVAWLGNRKIRIFGPPNKIFKGV